MVEGMIDVELFRLLKLVTQQGKLQWLRCTEERGFVAAHNEFTFLLRHEYDATEVTIIYPDGTRAPYAMKEPHELPSLYGMVRDQPREPSEKVLKIHNALKALAGEE